MLLVSDSMTNAQPRFRLHTKHKSELLFAVMRTLVHEDARISFEGRLSHRTGQNCWRIFKRNRSPQAEYNIA